MKRAFILLATLVALIAILSGCIPSLHPLYSPETTVFRRDLLGEWRQVDGEDRWRFERGKEENTYHLVLESTTANTIAYAEDYTVHLVKLGQYYFLDFFSEPDEEKNQSFTLAERVPTHGFARIDFSDDGLRIRMFDIEWLKRLFRERKIRLKHEVLEDGSLVLTAPTAELQQFVAKYAGEEQAYIEPAVLRRRAD